MGNEDIVLVRNAERAPKHHLATQTVAFSHYNHLSAQLPIEPTSGQLVEDGIRVQATQCLKNIQAVVENIDHVISDIVRITIFVKDMRDVAAVEGVYTAFFTHYYPARTVITIADLPLGASVQMEILVSNGKETISSAPQAGDLTKLTNQTVRAPIDALAGQTVTFFHYNNLSAQLPVDPRTDRVVAGCVKTRVKQCLKSVKAILTSTDVPFDDIVKINIHLEDLSKLEAINQVHATFFPDSGIAHTVNYIPTRTVIAIVDLPMGAAVQAEAVVSHGNGTPPQATEDRHGLVIKAGDTEHALKCPFSIRTVAFSHYNHLSAQLPLDPETNALVTGGIKEQTTQCLENIKAITESMNHSLVDPVKVSIFMKEIGGLAAVDDIYQTYFPEGTPARRAIGVTDLPKGAQVQIEAITGNTEGTSPVG